MLQISVGVFANNEVRIGRRVPTDSKAKGPAPLKIAPPPLVNPAEFQTAAAAPPPPPPSCKVAPGWGLLARERSGIRSIAAKRISQVGGAIEYCFPREQCLFVTLTLPGSSDRALRDFARVSSYCLNLIKSRLSKRFGYQPPNFHVWEHQKRGALHLHMCIATDSAAAAIALRDDWFNIAIDTLEAAEAEYRINLWERADGQEWRSPRRSFENQDAQIVEKSVVAYLSKYLTDGTKAAKAHKKGTWYSPPRYWGCSNSARDIARHLTATQILTVEDDGTADDLEQALGVIARHGAQWGVCWRSEWHRDMRGNIYRYPSWDAAATAYHAMCELLSIYRQVFGPRPLARAPALVTAETVTDHWLPTKDWIAKRLYFEQCYRNGTAPVLDFAAA